MSGESAGAWQNVDKAMADLAGLRQFSGPPAEFWPAYLGAVQHLTGADKFVLLARKPGEPWRRMADWPPQSPASLLLTVFFAQLEDFATRAFAEGRMARPLESKSGPAAGNFVIGARIAVPQADECVLVAVISEVSERSAGEAAVRLSLAAPIPETYQNNLGARQAAANVEKLTSALDLTVGVSGETKFIPTAFVFCNGLATRFNCDRVALGWLERGMVRLRAISRTEQFDRQMAAAQSLETAMEEALDQDNEIVWPAPPGSAVVARDHERFATEHKAGNVCTLPLRAGGRAVAAVTCERRSGPFTEAELQQLRLACDLAAPRLVERKERDRWIGGRAAAIFREKAARLIGPDHTWAKLFAILGAAVVAALVFLRVPYRVEGNFVLRSDRLAYLSAPFDGYIDEVFVRPGDAVKAGQSLLAFKTSELRLDESFALADVNRYQREAEKARASKALADMRVAEAMADQAAARLDLSRYRLGEATIQAPFDGVVVEGDLRERLGSPVKSADVLFKVARIDTLYVEAEVGERDIQDILGKSAGEIAFVAQPKLTFPVRIAAVEQAAVPKQDGNVFLVRCTVDPGPQPWWRPGMSGVCKFSAGNRALGWILTHRTVDFLRLKLWW